MVTMLMLVMMAGSALPAFATIPSSSNSPSDTPAEPVCGWDWDRYLWRAYEYELWSYTCDYGDGNVYVYAFWNPDWGYWYP